MKIVELKAGFAEMWTLQENKRKLEKHNKPKV